MFTYGYYTAMTALIKGLEAGRRRHLRPEASSRRRCEGHADGDEAPWGDVKLDDNRQAISDIFVKKIVKDDDGDGVPDVQTFRRIPDVDQTFGGFFTPDTPRRTASNPKCEKGDAAAVGRQRRGGRLSAK